MLCTFFFKFISLNDIRKLNNKHFSKLYYSKIVANGKFGFFLTAFNMCKYYRYARTSEVFVIWLWSLFIVASEWSSFKSWSEWTHCSRSCGGGTRERIRYRNCTKPRHVHGDKNCTGLDKDIIFEDCNTNICTSKYLLNIL